MSTNFLFSKLSQQCFAFTPQTYFPAHNLNFHLKGEEDEEDEIDLVGIVVGEVGE